MKAAVERRMEIPSIWLTNRAKTRVEDLADYLKSQSVTIRNDLSFLEKWLYRSLSRRSNS